MKDMEKFEERGEITIVPAGNSFFSVMQSAIQKNYTPEFIEKMMELQERYDAKEAKKAYVAAMAAFKTNPPEIEKDKKVSYETQKGTTAYSHASLANVTNKINKALGEHGLSAAWKTEQANGSITVTCTITHHAGYGESTALTAAPDPTGSKNSIQAIGSTISYLERYTILALTGLATHDMDDDGKKGEQDNVVMINDQQILDIQTLQKDAKLSDAEFKKRLKKKFKVEDEKLLIEKDAAILIQSLEAIVNG